LRAAYWMFTFVVLSSAALAQLDNHAHRTLEKAHPDDCDLRYRGDGRKAVKLRTAQEGSGYTKVNGDRPIGVQEWYSLTCSLDAKVPDRVPAAEPIQGVETQIVTLQGYLVAVKFDPDRDIHAEIGALPKWERPLVVVEVPPGKDYCAARKALWSAVEKELPSNGADTFHVMVNPPKVRVTGYVFLDAAPGKTTPYSCRTGASRGIKAKGKRSQVQGLWEVHPVFDFAAEGFANSLR
jgi:hypothetical protein